MVITFVYFVFVAKCSLLGGAWFSERMKTARSSFCLWKRGMIKCIILLKQQRSPKWSTELTRVKMVYKIWWYIIEPCSILKKILIITAEKNTRMQNENLWNIQWRTGLFRIISTNFLLHHNLVRVTQNGDGSSGRADDSVLPGPRSR